MASVFLKSEVISNVEVFELKSPGSTASRRIYLQSQAAMEAIIVKQICT